MQKPFRCRWAGRLHFQGKLVYEALRDRIQAADGGEYNSVLLNRYRDGDDGVGWHADKEKEMDPQHLIASVSLGACRKFKVRANDTREIQTFLLSSGSLLIMPAGFQQRYEHTVPAVKASVGERINSHIPSNALARGPRLRAQIFFALTSQMQLLKCNH